MAKSTSLVLLFLIPLLLSCNSGGPLKFAIGMVVQNYLNTWCVAKPGTSDAALKDNIEYACNILGDYCKIIQPGGSCFDPDNLFNHASVVMNHYYAVNGRNDWNCYFSNSGLIAVTDPITVAASMLSWKIGIKWMEIYQI